MPQKRTQLRGELNVSQPISHEGIVEALKVLCGFRNMLEPDDHCLLQSVDGINVLAE